MKVIFLHGNNTLRWDYAWTPWLKKELEKLNIECTFETLPDSIIARKEYWIAWLERMQANKNTLLIGHSSGATASLRYAENNRIKGSILIAPSATDMGDDLEKQSGYFDEPWNWDAIKKNQEFITLVYSDDDPYIPLHEFKTIADKLNPYVLSFKDKGHFMEDTFPELLEEIKQKVAQ